MILSHFTKVFLVLLTFVFHLCSTQLAPVRATSLVPTNNSALRHMSACFSGGKPFSSGHHTLKGEWAMLDKVNHGKKNYCSSHKQVLRSCEGHKKRRNRLPRKFTTSICSLPDFSEENFMEALGDRLVYFIGDSVIMQQKVRLRCDIMNSSVIGSIRISHEKHLMSNLNRLARIPSNSIALVNVGLHYNTRKSYAQFLHKFEVTCLRKRCTNAKLVWQETAAQHFPNSFNGYFQKRGVCRSGCTRLSRDILKSHDFRNQMANELLRKYDIPILEVWELTQAAQEMHVQSASSTGICDCTHFCNTEWGVFRAYNRVLQAWLAQNS